MGAEVKDERAVSVPEKPKAKAPNLYTKHGQPRQRYLRRLVFALPHVQPQGADDMRSIKSRANGDGTKRLGMGRARVRAYVRAEAAKGEPSVPNLHKRLSRQAWRTHKKHYAENAFRRFNPEGLAINVGQPEAA